MTGVKCESCLGEATLYIKVRYGSEHPYAYLKLCRHCALTEMITDNIGRTQPTELWVNSIPELPVTISTVTEMPLCS